MEREYVLSMVDLRLLEEEGTHLHWDPINCFYNHCHDKDGKFCEVGGSGVSGRSSVRDPDGTPAPVEAPVKRGPRGGSLVDPNEGTRTINGVRGYDARGKPVPGSDAYLEAHNISPEVFKARPYVKYEASKTDAALNEAFPADGKASWGPSTKGHKLFVGTAEQERQNGGYIMYKHQAPGSEHGPVAPQIRPNATVITDKGKWTKAKTVYENAQARVAVLEKTTPAQFTKERRTQLKQAEMNLEKAKKTTPEMARAEADKNLETAKAHYTLVKKNSSDPDEIKAAFKDLSDAKRFHEKIGRKTSRDTFMAAELETATLNLKNAQNRLKRSIDDPKLALANEIKSQKAVTKRNSNAFDKAAAKYLFTPGVSSARIDVNQDPQNLKNLTKGKGRIYLAMEGSIKNDAILTALKREDPTAAVVNVPSVTLWQQKSFAEGVPEDALGEMAWFAGKFAKKRQVILIPDADGVTNPAVMNQARALQGSLIQNGAGQVLLAIPPLKKGTTRQVDEFDLASGVHEKRKGIDDHLGAGRGTLGQLRYSHNTEYPDYSLTHKTVAGGVTKGEEKLSKSGLENAQKVLAAISSLVDTKTGAGQIPAKTMSQAAGFRDTQKTSALGARDTLERLGIIKVEYVFDKIAQSRGERILNPEMTEERRRELIKQGTIKEPHIYKKYTEVSYDESPVVTILDRKYVIPESSIRRGSLAELPDWKPPASFKGWTSAVTNKRDTTGIAARLEAEHKTYVAKNVAKEAAAAKALAKAGPKTAKARLAAKKAAPGRRLVRSAEGAKRYGVAIGQPIPLAGEIVSLTMLTPLDESYVGFYNQEHDKLGRFTGPGGSGNSGGVTGRFHDEWPSVGGRDITTVAKSHLGSVNVDGIKAKAVYEVTTSNGNRIRLYDQTGKADRYKDELLNNHARMNELYPLSPPRSIVVTKPGLFGSSKIGADSFGIVHSGDNHTYVNSKLLGMDNDKFRDGFQMPSAKSGDSKDMDYLLTHEYGHQLDFAENYHAGHYTSHPFNSDPAFNKSMSRYGQSEDRGIESYAEAFAEWNHTSGQTKNPAAIALARYEGWYGANGVNASVGVNSDVPRHRALLSFVNEAVLPDDSEDIQNTLPDEGIGIVDNYDEEESGPTILGDVTVGPSSEESIAKATAIMREVLSEMGLDYEDYIGGTDGGE